MVRQIVWRLQWVRQDPPVTLVPPVLKVQLVLLEPRDQWDHPAPMVRPANRVHRDPLELQAKMDVMDSQVSLVLPDPRVSQAWLASQVPLASLEIKATKARREKREMQASTEWLDRQVRWDLPDLQDQWEP